MRVGCAPWKVKRCAGEKNAARRGQIVSFIDELADLVGHVRTRHRGAKDGFAIQLQRESVAVISGVLQHDSVHSDARQRFLVFGNSRRVHDIGKHPPIKEVASCDNLSPA